jgi:hypothetical protein
MMSNVDKEIAKVAPPLNAIRVFVEAARQLLRHGSDSGFLCGPARQWI